MNSAGSCRLDFGSSTMRTGDDLSDSSRTVSSAASITVFRLTCSCASDFLPSFGLGFVARSMSSSTARVDTPNGSSVTAMRHWPRARSSTVQRARTRRLPRPLSYMVRMLSGSEMMWPPPGRSGPGMIAISSSMPISGLRMVATTARATSARLCEGMSVAMPTPMPEAPLRSSSGRRAGRSFGSWNAPS